jgi:hypothetical protein
VARDKRKHCPPSSGHLIWVVREKAVEEEGSESADAVGRRQDDLR